MRVSQIQRDVRDELSERAFVMGKDQPGQDLVQDLIAELDRFDLRVDLDVEEVRSFRRRVSPMGNRD